ncbi:P-loop containing nucleoside triphosphate hydrolase [Pseudocohnilembus persalinus]|uniref:p-loop containing nucleoside triphosphate hydrolase n=1 Tax=Pseudocohnilembus persalinus TaxID=266149 RepID=A0A0V0QSJ4_PSEPJ|nr:P-loop containing nucleoside triphosphate hydrolase [Pseudocohnilembus persalinus]|eukprot:KRX05294.1 P-loop containing nucleoside triphosphate hydrolase [Pseudocohnilembus persalinus]
MSSQTDYSKLIIGDPVKCIVRVKAPVNFQREDIKVMGTKDRNTVSITDANNRVLEEFDVQEAYGPEFNINQIFDNSVKRYLYPLVQGFSVSIFSFGSSGSGKSQTIEGNRKEAGLINLCADSLFTILEDKKHHTNQARTGNMQNYNFAVRCRFVEIIDEEVYDLFGRPGKNLQDTCHVVESIWEGPTIQNATWINVNNRAQVAEILASGVKSRNQSSNEFGRLASKATGMFTIELLQTSELDTMEQLVLISRMNFFDLPGSDILLDDPENIRIRQGSSLNKSIISLGGLMKDLSGKRNDYVLYETSVLTHLLKDALGGNSLTLGIFNIQNGDTRSSSLTLNFLKYARNIFNWPVVNDAKEIGLLKKYRAEVNSVKNNKLGNSMIGVDQSLMQNQLQLGKGQMYNDRGEVVELEKKLIENHLDKMRQADDKQRLANKLAELREKFNQIVREKGDLQGELIKVEEEKLEVSKALVELQIENTRLMEILQNDKYDNNNKLLNAENDLLAVNIREEKALKQIQELQDRLKDVVEDKRELEIEFVALKKNYISLNQTVEEEKLKNQNIGMELINMVNENKALHDEMNDIYKKSGNTSDENQKFINRIEKLDRENQEQREALVFAKAEIERLKTEMLKYDIQEQQHRLEMDQKKIDMEKGYIELTKEKQTEFNSLNQRQQQESKKIKDDKLYWESQKMELTHKNKLAQRKIAELEERIVEVQRNNDEITAESNKLLLQMDEMRSVYRQKLIQFTTELNRRDGAEKPTRIGYDMSAREELIRTYTEKEIELNEKLEQTKRQKSHISTELKALKNYARQLKYLAEDWAPIGVPLPEILIKSAPVNIDDAFTQNGGGGDQEEIDRLRRKNRKLEEDLKIMQDQLQNNVKSSSVDIQSRLMNEIQTLKGEPDILRRPGSSTANAEQLRRERNDLQEENRRLINMLKDNKKWDIYLLQRDNERLLKTVKEIENGGPVGPTSGGGDHQLRQKISYYEKTIKQMEKERSELMVRATMAEEQLNSMQEHLSKTTLDYQKKIVELKKSNARTGQPY